MKNDDDDVDFFCANFFVVVGDAARPFNYFIALAHQTNYIALILNH
jgi:hypothetical protein